LEVHEFVCADCDVDVFSFGGDPALFTFDGKLVCQSCLTIRQMKAREPMTPAAEAALREILGCVIPVKSND
jgi:hypothetical protein